jgi:hypothetical protein
MKRKLFATTSWLLLLIFSAVQVLPALHHHTETLHISQHTAFKHSEYKIDKHTSDCLICNFVAHKQIDLPINFAEFTIAYNPGKPLVLDIDYSQHYFQSAVHTWTNKGPPTV